MSRQGGKGSYAPGSRSGSPRIFTRQALGPHSEILLEEGPSRHLAGALRLQPGAGVTLFDGTGGEYPGVIEAIERRRVRVRLCEHLTVERESPLAVSLGIGMSRGDRMDWVVQKATELGVNAVWPLATERAELRLKGERAERKRAHWEQVAASACEQCGRNRLPAVHAPMPLPEWLQRADQACRLVLDHRLDQTLSATEAAPSNAALLIGPEGGLSGEEVRRAEEAGFHGVTLGPRVLRTETAPLVTLAVLQFHWGDLGPQGAD